MGNITEDFYRLLMSKYEFHSVIHLGVQSHLYGSMEDRLVFVITKVIETFNLLNVCNSYRAYNIDNNRLYHISTNEVYSTLDQTGCLIETLQKQRPDVTSYFNLNYNADYSGFETSVNLKNIPNGIYTLDILLKNNKENKEGLFYYDTKIKI